MKFFSILATTTLGFGLCSLVFVPCSSFAEVKANPKIYRQLPRPDLPLARNVTQKSQVKVLQNFRSETKEEKKKQPNLLKRAN